MGERVWNNNALYTVYTQPVKPLFNREYTNKLISEQAVCWTGFWADLVGANRALNGADWAGLAGFNRAPNGAD